MHVDGVQSGGIVLRVERRLFNVYYIPRMYVMIFQVAKLSIGLFPQTTFCNLRVVAAITSSS